MPLLEDCLNSILDQKTSWPFEVIVIDSGSTDGTLQLVKSLPVSLVCIEPHEFNHGLTRNFGVEKAKGEYVVFLVQDAVPVNNTFLQSLVDVAQLSGAAGSYGRELPWPSDHSLIQLYMEKALSQSQVQLHKMIPAGQTWLELSPQKKFEISIFHDTCSCLSRHVWEKIPYKPLPYGEDLDWGACVIQAGYKIVYEPQAAVYHSHDRSGWYEFKRAYADHELVKRLFDYNMFPRFVGVVTSWMTESWRMMHAIQSKSDFSFGMILLTLRIPVITAARYFGGFLGTRATEIESLGLLGQRIDNFLRKGV